MMGENIFLDGMAVIALPDGMWIEVGEAVLEIPTPTWYVYDAFRFGIEIPSDAPTSQQERAYTSPIWFTP